MDELTDVARVKSHRVKAVSIKKPDGSVIWIGSARSWRAAVVAAVREGVSLEGADLRRINLSRLDLTGANLRGALMDGADLRGCVLKEACLEDVSLVKVRAQGANFDLASMSGITAEDSDFTGCSMVFANLRHARLSRSVFEGVSAASCRLSESTQKNCSWDKSDMHNADFRDAEVIECSFKGTDLRHRAFGGLPKEEMERLSAHLPNRTAGANVVGCTYSKDTLFADTVPAMKADNRSTSMTRAGLWAASTLGVVTGVEKAFEAVSELGHVMNMGHLAAGGIIVVVSALTLLKESVIENIRERMSKGLGNLINAIRTHGAEINERSGRKLDLVILVGRSMSLEPIRMALSARETDARRAGIWSVFSTFVTGMGKVILCDRRHLAMAMATLCSAREKGFRLKEDITFLHCEHGCHGSPSPCVMHLRVNGSSSAAWKLSDGEYVIASYSSDGSLLHADDGNGHEIPLSSLPPHAIARASAMLAFEAAMLETHGLGSFHYNSTTHRVEEGRKGALLVRRRSNGRIGNKDGQPAIVPLEGDCIFMSNGSVIAP